MNRSRVAEYANLRETSAVQESPSVHEAPHDTDFKTYILYVPGVTKRDAASIKAIEELAANSGLKKETMIVDVDSLALKPAWLDQLPCLVVRAENKALKGEMCHRFIQEYKSKRGAVSWHQAKQSKYSTSKAWGVVI
jgi:hypothetical protein